jgi:xanthine dehydrogenase YagS FAD-binding subunit
MAAALLAYDAKVATNQRKGLSVGELLGDGSNGAADHALRASEMIVGVDLPPPLAGEHAAYRRAISRTHAEWPLVELVARVVVANGAFEFVRLAAGGVAPVPLRLSAAEAASQGAAVSPATIAAAARAATANANPLPMTRYKLDLLSGLVQDLLERCSA